MRMLLLGVILLPLICMSDQVGIVVPGGGSGSFNYDEIRTSSGTSCRQALGTNIRAEFGVVDSESKSTNIYHDAARFNDGRSSFGTGAYARVTYDIGSKKRLDCSRLFEIEIAMLKAELEMMRDAKRFSGSFDEE